MTKIFALILLVTPVFASAQSEPTKKTEVYKTITGELLKDCTGVDKKIAVAGFSYSDGRDSHDGGIVAERITTELVKAKKFKVIERKEIEKVFEELRFQHSGAINPNSAKEIGKMLGADWVVVGILIELPDKQLELNTRIVGVESGEILSAASIEIRKDWFDQYQRLLEKQNTIIEKQPKDAKAFYEQGVLYSDFGEIDNAIASLAIAISLNPTYSAAYFAMGNAHYYKDEDDKAIENYSKAIAIDQQYFYAYYNRAVTYLKQKDYDNAIENYSKAIEIDPKYKKAYEGRGTTYFTLGILSVVKGEYDKAIDYYSKAIIDHPNDGSYYVARGLPYGKKGDYDKAMEDYSKAIEINPKDAFAYLGRGGIYYKRGEYDKSKQDDATYERLKAEGPGK